MVSLKVSNKLTVGHGREGTRVGNKDVKSTEIFHCLFDDTLGLFMVLDIGCKDENLYAGDLLEDVSLGLLQRVMAACDKSQRGASQRVVARGVSSDPPRRPGDEDDLVLVCLPFEVDLRVDCWVDSIGGL